MCSDRSIRLNALQESWKTYIFTCLGGSMTRDQWLRISFLKSVSPIISEAIVCLRIFATSLMYRDSLFVRCNRPVNLLLDFVVSRSIQVRSGIWWKRTSKRRSEFETCMHPVGWGRSANVSRTERWGSNRDVNVKMAKVGRYTKEGNTDPNLSKSEISRFLLIHH